MLNLLVVFPAYIGPGAGFAFTGSFLTLVLSLLAAFASLLIWPFRTAWNLVRRRRRGVTKKLIFLGFDGLDPVITERLIAEGKLPNFARLQQTGSYCRLRTTFPALSPVAWSTFATGVNPGKHNIFDILNRDLRTYIPELSSVKITGTSVEMRRKSETFWKILGRHGVSSTILRVPVTFPPEEFNGRLLCGMCTPDLRGTQGTFSSFTESEGRLEGPPGETISFQIVQSTLEIQNESYPLIEGEYTPWIHLKFPSANGIVRFLLMRADPLSLYATPVQIDPASPTLPISHPGYYALYLDKLLGTFSTLGMAEDTGGRNERVLSQRDFLVQAASIQAEREAMFFHSLELTKAGVLACVFDTSDRVQHMCFGQDDIIESMYCDMDRVLGRTLRHVKRDTALFVLSGHGFCAFRRGVNLNTWLLNEGYLHLSAPAGDHFEGVDWSRTRAYTFGLGGLYLNIEGREARGIVHPKDAPALAGELAAKLTGLRDGDTQQNAINTAWLTACIYKGPYSAGGPDLIIGYAAGYRASWEAAVGKVSDTVFSENDEPWCGDHCVDPHLVPGVLFSNLKIIAPDPGIEDMAPTALALFGVPAPSYMEGKPVF